MSWFETLTGFREESPEQVRRNIRLEGVKMTSRVNGRVMTCGELEIPSLAELRARLRPPAQGRLSLREVVADVRDLHADPGNAGAIFQVASQFNLLEMVGPDVTPEDGVGRYETDHTQGPACAISAGAGTIYRNYFVPVNGKIGQTAGNQVDCLAGVGDVLGNAGGKLWRMKNGYALPTKTGLQEISERLRGLDSGARDELRGHLRIGLQWNTQVTLGNCTHLVSQAYCSALPIGYSEYAAHLWEGFTRLVLEAAYEATFCAAIINLQSTGNPCLFLTRLGGGAFGNPPDWIRDALSRSVQQYEAYPLEVAVVNRGA